MRASRPVSSAVSNCRDPIILLPGHLCDERTWHHQVDAFSKAGLQSRIITLGARESVAALAADVLSRIPEWRILLVGFSLGGYVALEIVRQVPHRVAALALISTSARPDHREAWEVREHNIERAMNGGLHDLVGEFVEVVAASAEPQVERFTKTMMLSNGAEFYIPQQRAIMTRPDSRPSLSAITCPTLVMGGGQDRVVAPEAQEELSKGIPHAKFLTIASAGHMLPLETPHRVSDALCNWAESVLK